MTEKEKGHIIAFLRQIDKLKAQMRIVKSMACTYGGYGAGQIISVGVRRKIIDIDNAIDEISKTVTERAMNDEQHECQNHT